MECNCALWATLLIFTMRGYSERVKVGTEEIKVKRILKE